VFRRNLDFIRRYLVSSVVQAAPLITSSPKAERVLRNGGYSGNLVDNIAFVGDLVKWTGPWRSLYSHHLSVEMSVVGVHVLSMLIAGGLAIAHDRGTLRAGSWLPAIVDHHFSELHAVHRTVVIALTVCMLSGVALFASDVKTYVFSIPFWIKMALIVLLLVNALIMTSAETRLRVSAARDAAVAAWTQIRATSVASAALWSMILLVSIVLSRSK